VGQQEELKALVAQEQELEQLRALLSPEHWPRIYELLKRVREKIRELELSKSTEPPERDTA
jgi:hypothetical protein